MALILFLICCILMLVNFISVHINNCQPFEVGMMKWYKHNKTLKQTRKYV